MATFFKDLYKPVKTILDTTYNTNGVEFKIENATAAGGKLEANINKKADAVNGDLKFSQSLTAANGLAQSISCKFQQNGAFVGTYELPSVKKGLKLRGEATLVTAVDAKDQVVLGAEYQDAKVAAIDELTLVKGGAATATLNATVVPTAGLLVGGQAVCDVKGKALRSFGLGVRYTRSNLTAAVLADGNTKGLSAVKVGFAQSIRPDLSVALQMNQKLSEKADPEFTVGVSKTLDDATSCKAKVNNKGVAAAVYSVKVNRDLTADLTVEGTLGKEQLISGTKMGLVFNYSPKA